MNCSSRLCVAVWLLSTLASIEAYALDRTEIYKKLGFTYAHSCRHIKAAHFSYTSTSIEVLVVGLQEHKALTYGVSTMTLHQS